MLTGYMAVAITSGCKPYKNHKVIREFDMIRLANACAAAGGKD